MLKKLRIWLLTGGIILVNFLRGIRYQIANLNFLCLHWWPPLSFDDTANYLINHAFLSHSCVMQHQQFLPEVIRWQRQPRNLSSPEAHQEQYGTVNSVIYRWVSARSNEDSSFVSSPISAVKPGATCWLFVDIYGSVAFPALLIIDVGNPYRLSKRTLSVISIS